MGSAVLLLFIAMIARGMTTSIRSSSPPNPNGYEELCSSHSKCRCPFKLESSVDCSDGDLTALLVAISFPDNVRSVSFQRNDIATVPNDAFANGQYVETLDLSFNRIKKVDPGAFQQFGNLLELNMAHNRIETIFVDTLNGLSKLRTLDLRYNRISELQPEVFKVCPDLKELVLNDNPLARIDSYTLKYLPNMRVLSLKRTGLRSIPDRFFKYSKNIHALFLDHNGLEEVPTSSFQGLSSLKYLELGSNPIKSIQPYAFSGLGNVSVLYLNDLKPLTSIKKHAFSDLSSLQEFHCSFSPMLVSIDPLAFKSGTSERNLTFLDSVYLRENALGSLPENLLPYSQLRTLDLGENPWYCDCNLRWTLDLPERVREDMRCAGPSRVENTIVSKLTREEMRCGTAFGEDAAAIVAIVCTTVLALLLIFLVVKMYQKGMFCGAPHRRYARVLAKREKMNVHYEPTLQVN